MMAVWTVAPAAAHQSGVPLAVTIALTVTALVALGMAIEQLRRTSRSLIALGGLGATSAVVVVALAIAIGSTLVDTSPQPAAAVEPLVVTEYALENYQLETLDLK
jgi:hypothetical protein